MADELFLEAEDARRPVSLAAAVAVLNNKVENLAKTSDGIERKLDIALNTYATKEQMQAAVVASEKEHDNTKERVKKLEGYVVWVVRLLIGAFLLAVVSLVIVGGKH